VTRWNLEALDFGLGFAIVRDPEKGRMKMGRDSFFWMGAFGTWFWIDPVNELIVVGCINMVNGMLPAGAPPVSQIAAKLVHGILDGSSGG